MQRAQRDVAGDHATHGAAMRRADDDQRGPLPLGGHVQRTGGRPFGHGEHVRRDPGALDLRHELAVQLVAHPQLVVRIGDGVGIEVAGIGLDGDEVAGHAAQPVRERERVAATLAAVDADDDRVEGHRLGCCSATSRAIREPTPRDGGKLRA